MTTLITAGLKLCATILEAVEKHIEIESLKKYCLDAVAYIQKLLKEIERLSGIIKTYSEEKKQWEKRDLERLERIKELETENQMLRSLK